MSRAAIIAEGISKRYRIGVASVRFATLGDALRSAVTAPVRRWRRLREHSNGHDTIWALLDVSFEVATGEVVGIIGRNGAGKSTLLKILSRITEPTEGSARLRGRVASLLEVGTGFHHELTGRENIYLNGAILGMRKAEIARKFDEIVAFAEIERFLDTPVKHYSSGMYVRLAFAVAAHLEPEILIVDEVLAVGDAEFQRKCLGRMSEVATSGRTVLFVSHNMSAVSALCPRAILLDGGRVIHEGDAAGVIHQYLSRVRTAIDGPPLAERTDREGSGEARFTSLRFLDETGNAVTHVPIGQPLTVELEFECERPIARPRFVLLFMNPLGQTAFRLKSYAAVPVSPDARRGGRVRCRVPALHLAPGVYTVIARLNDNVAERIDGLEAGLIEVTEADVYGTGRTSYQQGDLMFVPAEWRLEYE